MKKRELNDLRNKTKRELEVLIAKLREEIARARLDLAMRKTKNVNIVKNLRRNLAQVLSIWSAQGKS